MNITCAFGLPAKSATRAPLVPGPPAGYDHRLLRPQSQQNVQKRFPDLLPLVEQGTLIALDRPADYSERRTDGYQEPLELYLVGTAHVSAQSADDVRRVIRAVQPDAVVVELCRSRQAVMYAPQHHSQQQQSAGAAGQPGGGGSAQRQAWSASLGSFDEQQVPFDTSSSLAGSTSSNAGGAALPSRGSTAQASQRNPLSLSGDGLLPAFQRSMELGGASALLLRLLLSRLSARMADGIGVQGGVEFAAARQEAESLGAQLVLGDRPIEITLQRAWDALSWRQRAALARELLRGALASQQAALDAAAVERLKDDDAISLLFSQLSTAYPELVAPLVHERDLYLAWSLKRSKAVNGARRVVGVVGRGHLRGVCYALTQDAAGAQLRFRDLAGGKNVKADRRRQHVAAAGRFALETAAFGAAWYAWTLLHQ